MKYKLLSLLALAMIISSFSNSYAKSPGVPGPIDRKSGMTPHHWALSPAGKQVTLGDFPMSGAMSPDGKHLIITNDGQGEQSLQVIDTETKSVIQTVPYITPEALFLGVVFSPDGKTVYASAGGNDKIRCFSFENGFLMEEEPIRLSHRYNPRFYPSGLSISPNGNFLYVANNLDNSVSKIDLKTRKVLKTVNVGKNPYTTLLTRDGKLVVSNWGESSVTVLDPQTMTTEKVIPVGRHPNALVENPLDGEVYVTNSDSDTLSILPTNGHEPVQTLDLNQLPFAPTGAQPVSLTISHDGKTLFVANSGGNNIEVIDLSQEVPQIKGKIPTGWYPTGVFLTRDDQTIMVSNGKGLGAGPNKEGQYIGNMMKGTLSFIKCPGNWKLRWYTKQVQKNNPDMGLTSLKANRENPIPQFIGQPTPIKHVIYIIKENRTYDQILGDLPQGNGDPSLVTFGTAISPNHHQLATQFVTLDNFYADAEISAQGHNWTTAAKANDYVEKNWPANYSGRGRQYDFEGTNEATYSEKGFLWDEAKRSGISFRDYGEFISYSFKKKKWIPEDPSLKGYYDPRFPGWSLNISDLTRYQEWAREFDQYIKNGQLPQLEIVRLPNDHTFGTRPGKLSPQSMMAQNDAALGKLIDKVSHSRYWKDTAIFVVEDDAQNGWDHVDAHRTVALIASPYTQRGRVDSSFYDSTSMIKTIELILGMRSMTQFDATALPMYNSFYAKPNLTPYTYQPPSYPLNSLNTEDSPGAELSNKLDFSQEDKANEEELNRILWEELKRGIPYPLKK
ncbi:MAG TPA: alkaline phosphatase family protein [Candidatus Angelobacter sp.]|nr:alkaline phosphatase family protein [Candidatus Angelobacter sp.]